MTYYQEEIILIRILKMAIKDYSNRRYMAVEDQRSEITTFFKSEDFYNILTLLAIDEESFFNSLKNWKGGEEE